MLKFFDLLSMLIFKSIFILFSMVILSDLLNTFLIIIYFFNLLIYLFFISHSLQIIKVIMCHLMLTIKLIYFKENYLCLSNTL
jgi:hypothetical protein